MNLRSLCALILGILGIGLSGSAHAASAIVMRRPADDGRIAASTYDVEGRRQANADLSIESRSDGGLEILSEFGRDGMGHTRATARFAELGGGSLRLIEQRTYTFDADGRSVSVQHIDHESRRATCGHPGSDALERIELPEADRVVNVPMNVFLLPVALGEVDSLEFQLFLCQGGGARLMSFEAWREDAAAREGLIPVRYAPDLGALTFVAREMAPRLTFWFDASDPHAWMGHRLPLYSGGPEVIVVRDGIDPSRLTD
jgi:hypothetical protein